MKIVTLGDVESYLESLGFTKDEPPINFVETFGLWPDIIYPLQSRFKRTSSSGIETELKIGIEHGWFYLIGDSKGWKCSERFSLNVPVEYYKNVSKLVSDAEKLVNKDIIKMLSSNKEHDNN